MLTIGKYRHLMQCSDTRHTFAVLAIDHRGSLVTEMQRHHGDIQYADVVTFKTAVLRHLLPSASATLIDPDYGLPALTSGAIPGSVGMLAPLEVTDYTHRTNSLIPGWDVGKLKRAGFSGAKMLLYFHPDSPNAQAQTDMVNVAVEQCRLHDVPFFLEPIVVSLDPAKPLHGEERTQIIIETARFFSYRGVDVLKLEFPADTANDDGRTQGALSELSAACTVPWTLLSAGVSFDTFLKQAAMACEAGASGIIAGRAVWAEAIALRDNAREQFLETTGRERMRRLTALCHALAQPWTTRHMPPPSVDEGWYKSS